MELKTIEPHYYGHHSNRDNVTWKARWQY